jgi:hypothetical protein
MLLICHNLQVLYRLCTFSGYIFEQVLRLLAGRSEELSHNYSCYSSEQLIQLAVVLSSSWACLLLCWLVVTLKSCDSFCSNWAVFVVLICWHRGVTHSVQAEPCYASLLTSWLQLWRTGTHSVPAESCLLLLWLVVIALAGAETHSVQAEPCYASLLTRGYSS